jgi:hypothetical protein
MDWKNDDDARVKGDLNILVRRIDRMRRLKSGGIEAFSGYPNIRDGLKFIVERCKSFGLLLVPVGELEYWAADLMTGGPSRTRKAEWANEAAMKIRETPDQAPDLLEFMREMAKYHSAEGHRMA